MDITEGRRRERRRFRRDAVGSGSSPLKRRYEESQPFRLNAPTGFLEGQGRREGISAETRGSFEHR